MATLFEQYRIHHPALYHRELRDQTAGDWDQHTDAHRPEEAAKSNDTPDASAPHRFGWPLSRYAVGELQVELENGVLGGSPRLRPDGCASRSLLRGNQDGILPFYTVQGHFRPRGWWKLADQYEIGKVRTYLPQPSTADPQISRKWVTLVSGDINNDTFMDIRDYNILVGCYHSLGPSQPGCPSGSADYIASDIFEDGTVNQFDYNLWLRELDCYNGDSAACDVNP